MDIFSNDAIRRLLLFAPPFIISLTFHEFAHGWIADKLGDSTARYSGRLTIDPMAHISWMGTVIFPAISVLTGAPLFGWANPVPVDSRNFRKPRRDMAFVASAGPASNIFLAVLCTAILAIMVRSMGAMPDLQASRIGMSGAAMEMLIMAVQLNLFLAFFNLIPVPPLDGSRILAGVGGRKVAEAIDRFEMNGYGSWLLLILFFTGLLRVLAVPVYGFMTLLFTAFGLN
ncbi:MAG: site-2 protease family protein [Bdellovibrionales bacterium]|nr:site-2 protease family protein [Bdellovibrionales bacterium]